MARAQANGMIGALGANHLDHGKTEVKPFTLTSHLQEVNLNSTIDSSAKISVFSIFKHSAAYIPMVYMDLN